MKFKKKILHHKRTENRLKYALTLNKPLLTSNNSKGRRLFTRGCTDWARGPVPENVTPSELVGQDKLVSTKQIQIFG